MEVERLLRVSFLALLVLFSLLVRVVYLCVIHGCEVGGSDLPKGYQ